MSEVSEIFADMHKYNSNKKQKNKDRSTRILIEHNIEFDRYNNGLHLKVYSLDDVIDFWPSTGKYMMNGKPLGRGVFNLLKLIEKRQIEYEQDKAPR